MVKIREEGFTKGEGKRIHREDKNAPRRIKDNEKSV